MSTKQRFGIIYSVAFVVMIAMNYLVGSDVGTIADENQAIIQPAGYVFSIWGLIYILLAIWIIRLFFLNHERDQVYETLHYWPIANFILNAMWIVAFTQRWLLASVIIIIGLLITLIVIYKKITKTSSDWFDRVPFSVYFGWGTVATIVNIVDLVKDEGIEEVAGLNEYQWTLILLVIATVIALFVSLAHMDWIYPLVFVWSFAGIIVENENQLFLLTIVAGMGIVFHILAASIVGFSKIKTMTR
ncbi:MAG: tryptophan-rich sensory protein [Alkalibacterium sp.]|nr:tryptophan-rich sensory protein [Alkalibacterium sp.]